MKSLSISKQLLSSDERSSLIAQWGERVDFEKTEAYAIRTYLRCTTRPGRLVKREQFSSMLGILNPQDSPFSNFLFAAISGPGANHVTYPDYLTWLLTSKYGTDDEKYRLGFKLCDLSNKKCITKDELTIVLDAMAHVLTIGLQFEVFDSTVFVEKFWALLDKVVLQEAHVCGHVCLVIYRLALAL